ncbi:MAG: hypothetical protein PHY47_01010 [Lachnospiraceae bacterium]|nr:hypothetical protein [Lachnospiraceae bacterium]
MLTVTNVTSFPVTNAKSLKAKGVVTLNNVLELKYLVMEGSKGPFVTWEGTSTYDKKDGSGKGYNSPIFFTDKAMNQEVQKQVLAKYKGGNARPATEQTSSYTNDSSFAADDIPF